jgi:hypothetical protein
MLTNFSLTSGGDILYVTIGRAACEALGTNSGTEESQEALDRVSVAACCENHTEHRDALRESRMWSA